MTVIPIRRRFEPSAPAAVPALDVLPEALVEELEAAMDVVDALEHAGVQLRFSPAPGGRLQLELLDADGSRRRTLTACEALDVAAGRIAP